MVQCICLLVIRSACRYYKFIKAIVLFQKFVTKSFRISELWFSRMIGLHSGDTFVWCLIGRASNYTCFPGGRLSWRGGRSDPIVATIFWKVIVSGVEVLRVVDINSSGSIVHYCESKITQRSIVGFKLLRIFWSVNPISGFQNSLWIEATLNSILIPPSQHKQISRMMNIVVMSKWH